MKFHIVILFYTLLFNFTINTIYAQSTEDMKFAKTLFIEKPSEDFHKYVKEDKNEIEKTFSVAFMFYKNFISSQDIDACVFQPSCSVFAIECIHHEKSKLIAYLKISDRLMRCHPLVSKGTYLIDEKTGKYLDPIEN